MPAASSSPVDPVFCHLFAAADGLDGGPGHGSVGAGCGGGSAGVAWGAASPGGDPGAGGACGAGGTRSFTAIAEWAADTDERSALESQQPTRGGGTRAYSCADNVHYVK